MNKWILAAFLCGIFVFNAQAQSTPVPARVVADESPKAYFEKRLTRLKGAMLSGDKARIQVYERDLVQFIREKTESELTPLREKALETLPYFETFTFDGAPQSECDARIARLEAFLSVL